MEQVILPAQQEVEGVLSQWAETDFWAEHNEALLALRTSDDHDEDADSEDDDDDRSSRSYATPAPVYDVKVRHKYIDSIIRKIDSTKTEFPGGLSKLSLQDMRDVLAARIVVYFPMELAWVDRLLRSSPDFELHSKQTPKAYVSRDTLRRVGLSPTHFRVNERKTSGYSSLHYVVRLTPRHRTPRPWFELQVRTLAEELWGEIEHQLGYKPRQDTEFSVRRQFRVISDHLHAIDMHLDFIYDQLQHFQRSRDLKERDLINAENVPKLLSSYQIYISQDDIGPVTEILNGYGIKTVGEFQHRAQYQTLETILSAWAVQNNGARPTALVTLQILASLPANCEELLIHRRVRAFSDFVRISSRGRPSP